MNKNLMNLVSRLKDIRVKRGLSLTALSERSGLTRAQISNLENGYIINPQLATLNKYANGLDMVITFEVT